MPLDITKGKRRRCAVCRYEEECNKEKKSLEYVGDTATVLTDCHVAAIGMASGPITQCLVRLMFGQSITELVVCLMLGLPDVDEPPP